MAKETNVTLLTVKALQPYNENEVFTVGAADAAKLLETKKVVKYDPKNPKHVKALEEQRGKPADAA